MCLTAFILAPGASELGLGAALAPLWRDSALPRHAAAELREVTYRTDRDICIVIYIYICLCVYICTRVNTCVYIHVDDCT